MNKKTPIASSILRAGAAWCAGMALFALAACSGSEDADPAALVQPPPTETSAQLSVNKVGSGTVTSSPSGIACGADCTQAYDSGTAVTLKATAANNFRFSGWNGVPADVPCTGTGDCTVTLDHAKSVTATFSAVTATNYALSVTLVGSGSVAADVAGLNCSGATCSGNFAAASTVTLTATAASGFDFSGWSGSGISCSGAGPCAVPMSAARSVTATFTAIPVTKTWALTVTKTGSGSVASTPAGINCGSDCSETYTDGTAVKLAAVPASGYAFSGWSGACTGTNSCDVTMTAARNVAATFTVIPASTYALNTVVNGSGTLTSSPAGINCPTTCSTTLTAGSVVLTATPASGQKISGWSGACSGTSSTCTLTIAATTSAGVTFAPITQTLSVTTSGSGTVTSSPAGINCGSTCSASMAQGTVVTLTAQAASGSSFTGWGGACTGTSTCSVTLSAAKNVSATFTATSTGGSGSYDCADAAVLCVGAGQEYTTIQAAASAAKAGNTVYVMAGSYTGFTVSTSGTSSAPIRFVASGADVVIKNGGNTESDAVRLKNASYIVVEGFTIRNDSTSSPRIHRCIAARDATATSPMHGNVLRNNRCTASEAEGFYISQFADGLVEGNTISGSGTNGQGRMHGIYLANAGSSNTTIRGNTIYGNTNTESNGIHANGDLSVGGSGIIKGAVIEGNTIYGNGQNGINFDGVQDSTIQNNLVYGNARHALRDYQIDAAAGAARLKIVNNTFVSTGGWAIKLSEDAGGHVIFNNILFGSSGALSVGSTSLQADYNLGSDAYSYDDEGSVVSLASFASRIVQQAHALVGTVAAIFTNSGGSDYTLSASSAARNKGVASFGGVSVPAKDLAGNARTQGSAADIGAYEAP